jgi:hypothetical protein
LKEIAMNVQRFEYLKLGRAIAVLLATSFATAFAVAGPQGRSVFVLTSTNNPSGNAVEVFKLDTVGTPSLTLANTLKTGGKGGASTNAGILQFQDDLGAVANFGSNTVSQLVRYNDFVGLGRTIALAGDCIKPDSVALNGRQLFVVGSNCAESHDWPNGYLDGTVVRLSDPSAAQIAVGKTWAAVTLTSGSVLQLPLTGEDGPLAGTSATVTLPTDANNTPLGEAFWGNLLGFTPAHSPDSFALVDEDRNVTPIVGPSPSYPTNAPCWVAKGPRSVWYTGNSPDKAISIFFTDGQGGVFYKSIPLPGSPTDVTVSADHKWFAVIYSVNGQAYVAVYSIDSYGDLTWVATSPLVDVAAFSGVAISD